MKLFILAALLNILTLNTTAQYSLPPEHDFSIYKEIRKKHNPALAGVLSAVVPGAGQFYNRQPVKGLAILFLEASAVYFIYRYNNREECFGGVCKINERRDLKTGLLILIPVKTFSVFDAIHSANKLNQKMEIYFSGQQEMAFVNNGSEFSFAPVMHLKYTF